MARVGASTVVTKVVEANWWMQSGASSGRLMHPTRYGIDESRSGLPTTSKQAVVVFVASSRTYFFQLEFCKSRFAVKTQDR